MIRSLAASLLAGALAATGLAVAPASAHHPVAEFEDIAAPFACGTEWSGGTRAGHGENNWNLDFNRTSLVWPDDDHDLGQPLFAQGDGTVTYIGWQVNAGTYLDVDYGDYAARYIHLVDDSVVHEVGDAVQQGDTIALLGDTGNTNGFAHLHLEYWDSRGHDDARIWELKQAGEGQTEITFDGNIIDPDEVIVSTNCVGDALTGGLADEAPPVVPDDPVLAAAAALVAAEDPIAHLGERLAANGATSILDTTAAADFAVGESLAAVVPGATAPEETVLVVTHYRTRSVCADGDEPPCVMPLQTAIPTAITLALIEQLVAEPPDRTTVFLLVGDDLDGTALSTLLTPTDPNPDLDPLVAAATAAVHVGPIGDTATVRLRNDSVLVGTATFADPATIPDLDVTTGLTWHRLAQHPNSANWDTLAALGLPTLGLTDIEGPCQGSTEQVSDGAPGKVGRQLADAETLVRAFTGADAAYVAAPLPDRAETILDDLAALAALLDEAEPTAADTIAQIAAFTAAIEPFLADPPETLTEDDVTLLTEELARFQGVFVDEPCAPYAVPAPFTDVATTSFALADTALLFDLRITTGTTPTTYAPADFVTREQMAAFLGRIWRLLNPEAAPEDPMPFSDVDDDSFAFDDIRLLWELGITTGTSPTRYSPADFVTREQMAAFLGRIWRLLNPDVDESTIEPHPFTDVDPASFADDDIALIFALGVTTGTSPTTYAPEDFVTREQMAAFLARLLRRHTEPPSGELAEE